MKSFSAEQLSQQEQYKLLIGSVIPRPVTLVTTLFDNGDVNVAPFSFFNVVSQNPALVSLSVLRVEGDMKDTARNILETKEAVVHSVTVNTVYQSNQTASRLPYGVSELHDSDFQTVASVKIKTPGIQDIPIRFETMLHQHIPITNDAGSVVADLFLLRVVQYHIADNVYQDGYILADELNPVSRLAGNDYALLGERLTIERPN